MINKIETVLRIVGDLDRFSADATSLPKEALTAYEDELPVSELDLISAASQQPHLPDTLKNEEP